MLINVFHGGFNLSMQSIRDGFVSSKKKDRFIMGTGLYTSTRWETAEKYGRGSRKVYGLVLDLEKEFSTAKRVSLHTIRQDFISNMPRVIRELWDEYQQVRYDHGMYDIPLDSLNTFMVNYPHCGYRYGQKLNDYFVSQNAKFSLDYSNIIRVHDLSVIKEIHDSVLDFNGSCDKLVLLR